MYPARWGNGESIDHDFGNSAGGAISYNGGYYQKPVKGAGDPCPTGFRVPTEYEWASLLVPNTADNPSTYTDDYIIFGSNPSVSFIGNRNPKIVWVRVENGKTAKTAQTFNLDGADLMYNIPGLHGYAIYDKDEWDDYTTAEGVDLTAQDAPTPRMFLPAAGLRNHENGSVMVTGVRGDYWSSTVGGGYSGHFGSSITGIDVINFYPARAIGHSVRCISVN
jgi:hypothetical protein